MAHLPAELGELFLVPALALLALELLDCQLRQTLLSFHARGVREADGLLVPLGMRRFCQCLWLLLLLGLELIRLERDGVELGECIIGP